MIILSTPAPEGYPARVVLPPRILQNSSEFFRSPEGPSFVFAVPGVGIEPTCPHGQPLLRGSRLPIPPPGPVMHGSGLRRQTNRLSSSNTLLLTRFPSPDALLSGHPPQRAMANSRLCRLGHPLIGHRQPQDRPHPIGPDPDELVGNHDSLDHVGQYRAPRPVPDLHRHCRRFTTSANSPVHSGQAGWAPERWNDKPTRARSSSQAPGRGRETK